MLMNYFSLLVLLALIYHNIILINEESLILLCVIGFFWLIIEYFSNSIIFEFNQKILNIENLIKINLKQIILLLKKNLNIQSQSLSFFKSLKKLKIFCYNFVININFLSNKFIINNIKLEFLKRLQFISSIESQTAKLILALLVLRLTKIAQISCFFANKMNNKHFLCIYKINIKETINLLTI